MRDSYCQVLYPVHFVLMELVVPLIATLHVFFFITDCQRGEGGLHGISSCMQETSFSCSFSPTKIDRSTSGITTLLCRKEARPACILKHFVKEQFVGSWNKLQRCVLQDEQRSFRASSRLAS